MKKRMPRWLRIEVFERDGGRCSFRNERGEVCGRATELFIEDAPWCSQDSWNPSEHRLTCLYHLEGGEGLDRINWATAPRA